MPKVLTLITCTYHQHRFVVVVSYGLVRLFQISEFLIAYDPRNIMSVLCHFLSRFLPGSFRFLSGIAEVFFLNLG